MHLEGPPDAADEAPFKWVARRAQVVLTTFTTLTTCTPFTTSPPHHLTTPPRYHLTRVWTAPEQVAVRCAVRFINAEGLSDGLSMATLLAQMVTLTLTLALALTLTLDRKSVV